MAVQRHDGNLVFTAGEALEFYRRVKISRTTTTTPPEIIYADADDPGFGVTMPYPGKASYASGDTRVLVRAYDAGTVKIEAAGAFSEADYLYGADDGKVDDATSGGQSFFQAMAAAAASGRVVECKPIGAAKTGGLIHADIAVGSTLTNSTTETTLASRTVDGGMLEVGDVLEIFATVDVPSTNSTDTLTLQLKIGTEQICTTGAIDVADNDIGQIHAYVVIAATGASGSLLGSGTQVLDAAGTLKTGFIKDAASEDLSGDVAIALTGTWSVASASNQCNSQTFVVKLLRQ